MEGLWNLPLRGCGTGVGRIHESEFQEVTTRFGSVETLRASVYLWGETE